MTLAVTLVRYLPEGIPSIAVIQATPSGNYVAGGDTLNLNPGTWLDPTGKGVIGYPNKVPTALPNVLGSVGFTGSYVGSYANVVPGTTLGTYKLQQFLPGGTEFTAGAYNAAVLSGYWQIEVFLSLA